MIGTYTAAQIRSAEEYHLTRTPAGALMRHAAWRVAARALEALRSPIPGRRAVLLVGRGNNGGDALFAGVLLRRRGVAVTALCLDAGAAHAQGIAGLRRAGGRVVDLHDRAAAPLRDTAQLHLQGADIIIDGVVGIGARPPLRPAAAELVGIANRSTATRLAIDVPSGMHPDTGRYDGPYFRADITVTLGAAKTGLFLAEEQTDIVIEPIGMLPRQEADAHLLLASDLAGLLPEPGPSDNKFSQGVTGVAAGSATYPGAALLCVSAAVATRPGLVRYLGPARPTVVRQWPEVIVSSSMDETGTVAAWAVGPGMGTDGGALRRLQEVVAADCPAVVDADGLTLLASNPHLLAARRSRELPTVLIPHTGEFARLFPDIDPAGPDGKLTAARRAAWRSGAVILLKGFRTVIAAPDGAAYVNANGTPHLATAGSGDVLTGVIAALLAAGVAPVQAAALGAFLHGRAGRRSAVDGRAGGSALVDYLR